MRTHQRFKWAALLAMPFVIVLAMWPAVQRQRREGNAREATRALKAEMDRAQGIRPDVVRQLVESGADVNVRGSYNSTLLQSVIEFAHPDKPSYREQVGLIRFLLEHGADVNVRDRGANTPLFLAAMSIQPDAVRLLLDHGARVNTRINGIPGEVAYLRYIVLLHRGYEHPQEASPRQLRDTKSIIAMLKAAGAHE